MNRAWVTTARGRLPVPYVAGWPTARGSLDAFTGLIYPLSEGFTDA